MWSIPSALESFNGTGGSCYPDSNPRILSWYDSDQYYGSTIYKYGTRRPESPSVRDIQYSIGCCTAELTSGMCSDSVSEYAGRWIDTESEAARSAVLTATPGALGSGTINVSLANANWEIPGATTGRLYSILFDWGTGGTQYVSLRPGETKTGTFGASTGTLAGTSYSITCGNTNCSITHSGLTAGSPHDYRVTFNRACDPRSTVIVSASAPPNIPPPDMKILTVNKLGTGTGTITSSSGGINCGSGCTSITPVNFTKDTSLTLTITPSSDSTIDTISGATCVDSSGSKLCSITMSDNRTVDVTFTLKPLVNNPTVSCYASAPGYTDPNLPVSAYTTTDVGWTASASGGTPPYTAYNWTGDAPLNGLTGNSVSFKYTTFGLKNGKIQVTDSAGNSSPVTNCTNVVNVGPEPVSGICEYALNPNPTALSMIFINPSTVSNKSNITVNFPDICNDNIVLSASPSALPAAVPGDPDVPLTYKFYNPNTTTENSTIIWNDGDGYIKGLDFKISASKKIKQGSYVITLTGTSNGATPVVRTQDIRLNVTNVSPTFKEF
jgi:hypothetical protein